MMLKKVITHQSQILNKMAMICNECGGIIPDIMFNGKERNDCKNHNKPEVNIKYNKKENLVSNLK